MQMHVMQTNANTCYANKCKCILCKQIQKQILKKKIQPTPQISVVQIAFLVDHLASVFCSWPAQLGRFNIIICTNSICPVAQASRFSNLCCLLGMRFQLLFVSFIPPLNLKSFQDEFGLGRNWMGSQAVKATQTEEVEEVAADDEDRGEGEEEEGEGEVRGRKSFLTSKLARLLSFSQ